MNPTERSLEVWQAAAVALRRQAVQLIDHAGSGHIGGSMSIMDVLMMLYATADISPERMGDANRDRIVLSMGHVSPALYCVLAAFGFVDTQELFAKYRREPGVYEGHPNNMAPGVEWCNGCLGQGLSQGCGTALAQKLRGFTQAHTYVVMGDGEQSKGQLQEAMELAGKYNLNNLTAIVDMNRQQSSGQTAQVLDVDVAQRFRAANWEVINIDGHDLQAIRAALTEAANALRPTCILAHTVMGKGIPPIEDDWHYHGKLLTPEQVQQAMEHFDRQAAELPPVTLPLRPFCGAHMADPITRPAPLNAGSFHTYQADDKVDGRKACANVLKELAALNQDICVLDCDLAAGLGIDGLNDVRPGTLVECGIQEHNAMSAAGGLAACGLRTFFMDFGMFALMEPINQLRVLDQNHIPLKVIATHCGVDVGQDGKSHQLIDAIALSNILLGFELILPADPNQTDRALRYLAASDKPGILAVPRSVLPVLTNAHGQPLYGGDESFAYGQADWLRRGRDAAIVAYGVMVHKALEAAELLARQGIDCGVLNVSAPKALDEEKIRQAAATGLVLVAEDHNQASGLGAMLGAYLMEHNLSCAYVRMGVTAYGISAPAAKQYAVQHLQAEDLANAVAKARLGGQP